MELLVELENILTEGLKKKGADELFEKETRLSSNFHHLHENYKLIYVNETIW